MILVAYCLHLATRIYAQPSTPQSAEKIRVACIGDSITEVIILATDIAIERAHPLMNWAPLATNVFDTNGVFQVANTIFPGNPQQFYRIQLQ